MPALTYSARAVAVLVAKRGVKCDAKRVRAWARDHIARLDDDAYTSHAYTAAERDRIVAALIARSRPDAKGTAGRASSASRGRSKSAPKRATAPKSSTAPKTAPTASPAAPESPEA